MSLPILYSFRRCPYAMRARLALRVAKHPMEHREILLRDKPASMLSYSPKGTVPVLVLPSGECLQESLDIMLWALRIHDPKQWLSPSHGSVEQILALLEHCENEFKPKLDRYKYNDRFADISLEEARAQASVFVASLQDRLTQHPFLFGKHFSLADAALAPFVRQFAHTQSTWFAEQSWDALQRWLANFANSVLFQDIMQKHPLWQEEAIS